MTTAWTLPMKAAYVPPLEDASAEPLSHAQQLPFPILHYRRRKKFARPGGPLTLGPGNATQ